ncbi:MAG: DNA primase [Caldisericaceae bacterium]|nr:DNA primase [Caldisericaceae bacterium]
MKDLKDYIDELHEKVDIVSIISQYVKLKKRGRNYVGLCPFHEEKTPSFVVSPEKQIFHCFGCGASGDVIKFLMKIDGMDFKEAITILARDTGMPLPTFSGKKTDKTEKDNLREAVQAASNFFHEQITKDVLLYLKQRGVTKESIEKFQIGYAPQNGDKLIAAMKKKDISQNSLLGAGILKKMDDGKIKSYFRNRIILPIFDIQGKIVAFGGRIFGKGEPKYLNSPDTPIFLKGNLLYPINIAKEGIRKEKQAIIVEGYFDALILHQSGVQNVVSSMGTSFTDAQAGLIKRYTDNVCFFYDDDEGGRKGAERAVEICSKKDLTVKIIVEGSGQDPDEIVLKKGKNGILELIGNAKDPLDFITSFELKIEGNNPSGKGRVAKKVLEIIDKISNKVEAYEYVKQLGTILNIDPSILFAQYTPVSTKSRRQKEKLNVNNIMSNTEKLLTQAVIQRPETLYKILEKVDINYFPDSRYRKIFNMAKKDIEKEGTPDIRNWNNLAEDEFSLATALSMGDPSLVSDKAIEQTIKRMNNYIMQSEVQEQLYNEIKETKDEDELRKKLEKYQQQIIKKLKKR